MQKEQRASHYYFPVFAPSRDHSARKRGSDWGNFRGPGKDPIGTSGLPGGKQSNRTSLRGSACRHV
jgi:hypothetical protein